MNPLFTVGHSNHELDVLLDLLKRHRVEAVADVRSEPFSPRYPQFSRPVLERTLWQTGRQYVFLGRELGARREERDCYVDGQARYDLAAKTPAFAEGLRRVISGLCRHRVALLCAEKDPLMCHRAILVCRHLRGGGFPIHHILADGSLESHPSAEERLLQLVGLAEPSLFASLAERIEEAYDLQGAKIAYREAVAPAPTEASLEPA